MENGGPGGGRWIEVAPDRLARWLESFAERHGGAIAEAGQETVTFRAPDGAVAECHVPFPPLAAVPADAGGADAGRAEAGRAEAGRAEAGRAEVAERMLAGQRLVRPAVLPGTVPRRRPAPGTAS